MLKDYFEVPNKPAIKSGNILSCDFTDHETFIPQPLDYSRGTLATYVDCNGFIKMSGVSDTELVTNGDFATDSNWTKEAGWTISEGTANFSGGTGNRAMYQAVGITNGKTYKIQYEVSSISAGQVAVRFGGMSGVGEITATTIGIYTGYITATGSANGNIHIEDNDNNFVGSIDNVSVREVDVEIPRIDYTTEIGKAKELQKPSLLLENESTNLIKFSEEFSNAAWAKSGASVVRGFISPDGSANAYKLIGGTNNGAHFISLSKINSSVGTTLSVFAKAAEKDWIVLYSASDGGYGRYFNVKDGIKGNNFGTTPSDSIITALSNGWYKCSIVIPNTTGVTTRIYVADGDSSSSYQGDGTSGVYIFGAQLEEGFNATSYIPTSGSTVTRNRETARLAGQLGVFNSQEGTLYAEFASLGQMNISAQRRMGISDNTNNNRASITISNGNPDRINFLYRAGGVNQFVNTLPASLDITNMNKFAFTWKQGEYRSFYNGQQHNTGNLPTVSTVSFENFGFVRNSTTDRFYARVRGVKVFRRALTFEELTELTNNIV